MLSEISEYDVVNSVPMTVFHGVQNSKLYLVNTMNEWKALHGLLMSRSLVACDTETSGFDWFKKDHIVGMSFGWEDMHFYVPVRHEDSITGGAQPPQLSMEDVIDDVRAFFDRKDLTTIFHNSKFDRLFYAKEGVDIKGTVHDTLILWLLHDENAPGALKQISSGWTDIFSKRRKGLVGSGANDKEKQVDTWRAEEARETRRVFAAMVREKAIELRYEPEYQAYKLADLKAHVKEVFFAGHPLADKGKEDVHYGMVPIPLMAEYAALDTFLTWQVYDFTMSHISWTAKMQELYKNEIALTDVLIATERRGIRVNKEYLQQLSAEYGAECALKEKSISEKLGGINLNSTKQLAEALQGLGAELTKQTDSGALSVDKSVLEKLAKEHAVVAEILELRTVQKLKNTYADSICDKLVAGNILHCSFNQNVSTGRMSSQSPNLQNIPGRDTSIRRAFIPLNDDYVYIFCDYSQIEVRLTAHYSKDPLLLDAYRCGQDVHTRTMCEMFNYDYDHVVGTLDEEDKSNPEYKVFKDLRNVAKRINFGIIYGVGAPGLSEQISRPDQYKTVSGEDWVMICQSFIDTYLYKYIGVKRFINTVKKAVKRDGYVVNNFCRVRHLPWINATKITQDPTTRWMEGRAERQAVNFIIQGDAADLFKTAAVRVHDLLKPQKSHIVNFVHDEIQIYLHKDEFSLLPKIKSRMEDFQYAVPIVADFEYTTANWAEKKSI